MAGITETTLKDFLFADVICYTLLRLYVMVAYAKGHVPLKSRNVLLLKQLKVYSKQQKYKPVKADIRRLIHYGRSSGVSLEDKILKIQSLAMAQPLPIEEGSDLSRFQDCLESINNLGTIETDGINKSKTISRDTVYLKRNNVMDSFDESGNLKEPIKMYIPTSKWVEAMGACERNGCKLTHKALYLNTHIVGEFFVPSNA